MSLMTLPARSQGTKINLIQGTILGVILTGLSFIVGLGAGWIETVDYLEVFAVFTSYVCTYLCVFERRVNYPIGAVSNAAYSFLFFQFGLYASSITTAYLTIALAYGWFRWKSDTKSIPVAKVEAKWIPAYIASTAVFYIGVLWLVNMAGGTLAMTDTVILIGTMLAQFLLDNKKIETWYVWMIVNVFAIYTYGTAGLTLAAFQYIFFLANTFYGLYMWKHSETIEVEVPEASVAPVTLPLVKEA